MHAWEQIQITIDYIEEHIGEEISIEELAKMAALSLFYYQRLFHRLVKKPVAEYIKLRRMARGMDALTKSEKRILDIAVELGFATHEHFTRSFKNTFGVTPEEYRKNPKRMNCMTKPELLLNYVLIDEGVPLITDGIVIEIRRFHLDTSKRYAGLEKIMPVEFCEGLGTESGEDPLIDLWNQVHEEKYKMECSSEDSEEIGVALPCDREGYFKYYAGTKVANHYTLPENYTEWILQEGDYVICSFEAENFDALVMDALYKAEKYLYDMWLAKHKIQTEYFCAELYEKHTSETTKMEIWVKVINQ